LTNIKAINKTNKTVTPTPAPIPALASVESTSLFVWVGLGDSVGLVAETWLSVPAALLAVLPSVVAVVPAIRKLVKGCVSKFDRSDDCQRIWRMALWQLVVQVASVVVAWNGKLRWQVKPLPLISRSAFT
jgi:hypothetical protein